MILYHFTDIDSLLPIMQQGLCLAHLNDRRASGLTHGATWLTTMDSPHGHGLTFGEPVTDFERQCIFSRHQKTMPASFTRWPDKSRVRIKVVIPSRDRNLVQWTRWNGRLAVKDEMDISKLGGATRLSSRSWFIYFGVIEPTSFAEVLVDGFHYVEQREVA